MASHSLTETVNAKKTSSRSREKSPASGGATDLNKTYFLNIEQMATTTTTIADNTTGNPDFHIVKEEVWDADVMDVLLTRGAEMGFASRELRMLSAYKRARASPGTNKVIYYFAKGTERDKLGRLYVRGMEGLQGFPNEIRNPLLEKNYWEVDFENAHYWLMKQLARQWKMEATEINNYVENRKQWLDETDPNPKVAKMAFLKVAYGGSVIDFNPSFIDTTPKNTTFILKVEEEVKAMREMCWTKHPHFHKHSAVKSKRDPKASLFALILQNIERVCLLEMDAFLKTKGRSVDVLIHDAGAVRKVDGEVEFPPNLMREAEAHIKTKTGYDVKLVSKGFKHDFKKPEKAKEVIDDEYASRQFVKLMDDLIAREDDRIYYFNDQTGLWEANDTAYLCAVAKHKMKLIFKIATDAGEITINYGGNLTNVKAMKAFVPTVVPDTKFLTNNADSSYGKLLFADGIYDFYTNSFTAGFNPKIVFNKRIDRRFPTHRNEELIKLVRDTLFVNAFNDEDGKEAGDFLRKALVMGLVGDYERKKFYFGLGEADCGKGVMVCAFTNAFGDYVGEWNANQLKYNSKNSQDEARKLAWVKDLIGCRLAFSNELRMDKIPVDGNLMKAVSSGGDSHKVRANYENEQKIINRATMFLLANDMLPITPSDSGVKTRCRFIRYKLRFVPNPSSPDERQADTSIKSKFAREEWKDALFFVMVDSFQEMTEEERKKGGQNEPPACVLEETAEWIGDDGSGNFAEHIRSKYEITGNPDDCVPSKAIVDFINDEKKMALSANKIGRMLSKLIQTKNPKCERDRQPTEGEVGKQRLGIRLR
jgi:hypothetical protein